MSKNIPTVNVYTDHNIMTFSVFSYVFPFYCTFIVFLTLFYQNQDEFLQNFEHVFWSQVSLRFSDASTTENMVILLRNFSPSHLLYASATQTVGEIVSLEGR